jgi:predicted amidophosphoribosyltransferase
MIECPYCYKAVKPQETVCGNCGKPIERWQTGFYTRKELPAKSRTAVWVGASLLFLLVVAGFARSCHWL